MWCCGSFFFAILCWSQCFFWLNALQTDWGIQRMQMLEILQLGSTVGDFGWLPSSKILQILQGPLPEETSILWIWEHAGCGWTNPARVVDLVNYPIHCNMFQPSQLASPKCCSIYPQIRRPGSACTVFFSYVASKILSRLANPKSPVPQTPKISKIQNPRSPKSKIQNPQNPKSPNSKIQTLHIKICYIMFQKSKIQNPQNPENPDSKIPKIQNPKSPKSPKSKIQNPLSPKSKIQNPQNPKSCIPNFQNPKISKSPPKSKIWGVGASHKELLHNDPKSKIQNPEILAKKVWIGDFGFWILDLGFRPQNPKSKLPKIQNPKSKIPKIQNLKSPKSKIQNLKSPKSKIPKIQNPKSSAEIQNLGRWRPHVKNCFLMIQNPKSKIPKSRPKKFGFWILGILDFGDFGFWDFGDFGFWIVGILDFGFWDFGGFGFCILGILVILDFGFWDFGDFGFWGFWILGILDFGDFGYWILGILDFGFWDFGEAQGMYH